jgi:hypothetical protein
VLRGAYVPSGLLDLAVLYIGIVGVLDTEESRSTCSWASSTAQLRPRGETIIEAVGEDPHEEAPQEENDDQNC